MVAYFKNDSTSFYEENIQLNGAFGPVSGHEEPYATDSLKGKPLSSKNDTFENISGPRINTVNLIDPADQQYAGKSIKVHFTTSIGSTYYIKGILDNNGHPPMICAVDHRGSPFEEIITDSSRVELDL